MVGGDFPGLDETAKNVGDAAIHHLHEDIVDGYDEDWSFLFELRVIDVTRNVRFTA
jgi:hypothetical protein